LNSVKKLFVIAAEPSGDSLGADFIEAVRAMSPTIEIKGMGGEKMAAAGVESLVSIDGLSVLGIVEALGAWKIARNKACEVAVFAKEFAPDAIVLIDSWGFTTRAAKEIRKRLPNTRIIKMIGPQVWATRPKRAKIIAEIYDEIWCIHDFELPFYQGLNITAKVIGNPALGRVQLGNSKSFIDKYQLENKRIIGLLPGSRKNEVRYLLPIMAEAVEALNKLSPNLAFVTVAADAMKAQIATYRIPQNWIIVDEADKLDAFAAMKLAVACSGTVTSELAIAGVPIIVGYKLDGFTYFVIKNFLLKAQFVTLLNVASRKEIAKELLQDDLTTHNVVSEIIHLLDDEARRGAQIEAQNVALQTMGLGKTKAAFKAAQFLLGD
jgi:lipid-A-disaccharide synthase